MKNAIAYYSEEEDEIVIMKNAVIYYFICGNRFVNATEVFTNDEDAIKFAIANKATLIKMEWEDGERLADQKLYDPGH